MRLGSLSDRFGYSCSGSAGYPARNTECMGVDNRTGMYCRYSDMDAGEKKALRRKSVQKNAKKIVKHERPPEFKGKAKRIKG